MFPENNGELRFQPDKLLALGLAFHSVCIDKGYKVKDYNLKNYLKY